VGEEDRLNASGQALQASVASVEGGAPDVDARSAVFLAIKNAFTLGGALVCTQSIGLAMRVIIPRHLGPTLFGDLNWSDAFTATLFVLLGLGVDQYIRKEVAVRPEIVSEFYGGVAVVRVVVTAGIFASIWAICHASHRSAELTATVFLYALTQFVVTANATLGAMLQAKGRVRGSSALSVATKVIWAVGVMAAIVAGTGLWGYGAAYFASEAVEVVALTWLARRHLGLVFRIDPKATKHVLLRSLPYSVTGIATAAYGTLGPTLLEFTAGGKERAGSTEVGFYGASWFIASLMLLVTPILGWVLTPMLARAASRSRAELFEHACRSMELVLTLAIPASLLINLGADVWTVVVFGPTYASAALTLRVLSTVFVLTYVAIIYSTTLIMLERAWTTTWIALAGLIVNALLNLVLVPYSAAKYGVGGGAAGCGAATLLTEIFVCVCMAVATGPGAFDRRSIVTLVKSLGLYAVVVGAHMLLKPMGAWRLAVDGILYGVLAVAIGAVRPKELISTVREAMGARTPAPAVT
jgi:O-antigen/teichoic acid export membrane protein